MKKISIRILTFISIVVFTIITSYKISISADTGINEDPSTFLDYRSNIKSNINNDFFNKEFQYNDSNFDYCPGYEIANLEGENYDLTLRDMNYAIRNSPKSSYAGITVFASGQGGDYTQWLNIYVNLAHFLDTFIYRVLGNYYLK